MLRSRAAAGRTADLGRYVDAALTSADRAAALTHRLLAFARLDAVLCASPTIQVRISSGTV
jgi:signal transduction histidine kinase